MASFDTANASQRRYAVLVAMQISVLSGASPASTASPAAPALFAYYPVFLDAARMRYLADTRNHLDPAARARALRATREKRDRACMLVRRSAIHPVHRDHFLWHMEEGIP